jgi:hypothetical protein
MQAQTNSGTAQRPGFFSRLFGGLVARIRRIFGKGEPPNIYPFY